jgi:hypothetical protein
MLFDLASYFQLPDNVCAERLLLLLPHGYTPLCTVCSNDAASHLKTASWPHFLVGGNKFPIIEMACKTARPGLRDAPMG